MAEQNVEPRFPGITVQLSDADGNAMSIMALVTKALRRNGHADQIPAFMEEAMDGDYDHVLRTVMRWVDWE